MVIRILYPAKNVFKEWGKGQDIFKVTEIGDFDIIRILHTENSKGYTSGRKKLIPKLLHAKRNEEQRKW